MQYYCGRLSSPLPNHGVTQKGICKTLPQIVPDILTEGFSEFPQPVPANEELANFKQRNRICLEILDHSLQNTVPFQEMLHKTLQFKQLLYRAKRLYCHFQCLILFLQCGAEDSILHTLAYVYLSSAHPAKTWSCILKQTTSACFHDFPHFSVIL